MGVLGTNLTRENITKIVIAELIDKKDIYEIIQVYGNNVDFDVVCTAPLNIPAHFCKNAVNYQLEKNYRNLPVYTCKISHKVDIMDKEEAYRMILTTKTKWEQNKKDTKGECSNMKRAMITAGENKGKTGEVVGMFFGVGICVIRTDDGKEYLAKLNEIKNVEHSIKKYTVIGLPKEMIREIGKNHDIIIYHSENGVVFFEDLNSYRGYQYIECQELFFDVLKKEYKIELPNDYSKITVFASSEEQIDEKVFDFHIGIMF